MSSNFSSLTWCFVAAPLLPSSHSTPSITNIASLSKPYKASSSHNLVSLQHHIKESLVSLGKLWIMTELHVDLSKQNTEQFAQHPTHKTFWKINFRYLLLSSKFHPHEKHWKSISFSLPFFHSLCTQTLSQFAVGSVPHHSQPFNLSF